MRPCPPTFPPPDSSLDSKCVLKPPPPALDEKSLLKGLAVSDVVFLW